MQLLKIGQLTFENNLIQGPLAGISCAPFRELIWQYSQPAYTCTEMISCQTLNHAPLSIQKRYVLKAANEGPVCFQLAGKDPREISEAVKRVTDLGADLIDLNCGCPVKKIRRKGMGSRLLQDPQSLYAAIVAMKQSTHLPVTVKVRVQGGSQFAINDDIANAVTDAGADALIVHGRNWTEHYEKDCNYSEIKYFVDRMSIPVIGNGDVCDLNTLNKMLETGCAGVMIARAGVGQPWLVERLTKEANNQLFQLPLLKERGGAFLRHVTGLQDLLQNEKFAVLQARTFAKYYARELPFQREWMTAVNQVFTLDELVGLVERYYS